MTATLFLAFSSYLCNLASSFTAAYSKQWGPNAGRLVTALLRNLLGLPLLGAAFVAAVRASDPAPLRAAAFLAACGWILILAGGAVIVAAVLTLRLPAAAPSVRDRLVRRGLYSRVRHPLYVGVLIELAGAVGVHPSGLMALLCVLTAVWVVLQAVFEERDLLVRMPDYRDYMDSTGRFFPRRALRRG